MNFLDLMKIEFMKVRRSRIIPMIFIAPLLVVSTGIANLSRYFTPSCAAIPRLVSNPSSPSHRHSSVYTASDSWGRPLVVFDKAEISTH